MIEDETTQETAAIMRLISAAERTGDRFTADIAFLRAIRLIMDGNGEITEDAIKILGLDRVKDIPNDE